jgi:hypothetical protein
MPHNPQPPDFDQFTQWTAVKFRSRGANANRYDELLTAARAARDENFRAAHLAVSPAVADDGSRSHIEVLQLLAAASVDETRKPPELTTARGFRVSLAYDDGDSPAHSSICVLVQSPPEMLSVVQGRIAYLWNGSERFELGQFDIDGKAIGTLPAGVQISLLDFEMGNVKLEEPADPDQK